MAGQVATKAVRCVSRGCSRMSWLLLHPSHAADLGLLACSSASSIVGGVGLTDHVASQAQHRAVSLQDNCSRPLLSCLQGYELPHIQRTTYLATVLAVLLHPDLGPRVPQKRTKRWQRPRAPHTCCRQLSFEVTGSQVVPCRCEFAFVLGDRLLLFGARCWKRRPYIIEPTYKVILLCGSHHRKSCTDAVLPSHITHYAFRQGRA